MTRWLAHGIALAVMIFLFGCVSSPRMAAEDIGFTRAPQLGGADNLWIMHHDGSGQSQLHLGADGNSSLTWSPDGNYIAFESVRDGNLEIYTARVIDNSDDTYSPRTFNEGPPALRTIHLQHGRMIALCLRFRLTEPTRIITTFINSM